MFQVSLGFKQQLYTVYESINFFDIIFSFGESEFENENQEEEKKISQFEISDDDKFDRAKGAVIGALCGDAIGAVLEFYFK